jgi:hypothetical protein
MNWQQIKLIQQIEEEHVAATLHRRRGNRHIFYLMSILMISLENNGARKANYFIEKTVLKYY